MSESRLSNSIRNGTVSVASQLLVTVLNFVCRTVFIYKLGNEYLGVNGLFTNILSMLSLSEMGIGTAIVYNMYKAVEQRDEEQINRLMSFYAKVYAIIGSIIMLSGVGCSFFIQYLIKDNIFDLSFLRTAFLLQVFNNAVSYFISYRSCILFANQKDWICKVSSMIVSSLGCIAQIITLFVVHNYFVYLIIQIGITIANNGAQFILAKKLYPNVKIRFSNKLTEETYSDIVARVKALLVHSVSSAINFGTDNIIISKFVGILETGFYSNYSMIITTINALVSQMLNGIVASMGNLMVSANKEKIYEVYQKIDFVCVWIYGMLSASLICLIDPFVNIWTGEGHLLNRITVIVLIINFYILGVRQAIMITRNAGGLYTQDRIVAVIKPIINLVFSIFLVQFMGITGVFVGTLISQLVADVILFPYYLYKNIFGDGICRYYLNYFKNAFIVSAITLLCLVITKPIFGVVTGIIAFLINGIICVLVYNIVFVIINFKRKEFIYFKNLLKRKLIRR